MTAAEQEVAPDVESLTLRIENLSDQPYTYGVRFELETEKDGVWYTLEPKEDIMWIEIACVLEPGGANEEGLTIRSHYGNIDKGNYRIVKTFTSEDGENIAAFAPFSVV